MAERVVHFFSEGTRLEGDLFVPEGLSRGERRPGIVLCHGYSGIRELILPDYARKFVAAGYVALSFDYRGFGGSEGTRGRLIPLEQIDDIRNAITFAQTLAEIDPDRIGLWGTSFGGFHAPYAAGVDSRVKAAVGQVGGGDGERFLLDTRNQAEREAFFRLLDEDRKSRVLTGKGSASDTATILASPQTRNFFKEVLPAYPQLKIDVQWESAEKTLEYKPVDVVHKIAPRALLLIGAVDDDLCKIGDYRNLIARAGEPKKLVELPIKHYDIYQPEWVEKSAALAIDWYDRYLR
jgi:uncharacterized protein